MSKKFVKTMPLGRMLNLRGTDNEDGRNRGTSLDRGIDMAPDMLVDMKVKPPNIKDLQKNVQNKGRLSFGILFIFLSVFLLLLFISTPANAIPQRWKMR